MLMLRPQSKHMQTHTSYFNLQGFIVFLLRAMNLLISVSEKQSSKLQCEDSVGIKLQGTNSRSER